MPRALTPRWLRFAAELAWRDLRTRYAGSAAGAMWNLLLPLATILIYLFLFTQVFQRRLGTGDSPGEYAVFLCAGLLPWVAFTDVAQRMPAVFRQQAGVMKRLPVPKLTIVLGAALPSAFTLALSLVLLSGAFAAGVADGHWALPLAALLLVPVQLALTTGLGMVLSMMGVFVRDTTAVLPLMLQVAFWLTPILYPLSALPGRAQGIMQVVYHFHPFYGMLRCFQMVISEGRAPGLFEVIHVASWIAVGVIAGGAVFRAHHPSLADLL